MLKLGLGASGKVATIVRALKNALSQAKLNRRLLDQEVSSDFHSFVLVVTNSLNTGNEIYH